MSNMESPCKHAPIQPLFPSKTFSTESKNKSVWELSPLPFDNIACNSSKYIKKINFSTSFYDAKANWKNTLIINGIESSIIKFAK
jgi:hypothetical protein